MTTQSLAPPPLPLPPPPLGLAWPEPLFLEYPLPRADNFPSTGVAFKKGSSIGLTVLRNYPTPNKSKQFPTVVFQSLQSPRRHSPDVLPLLLFSFFCKSAQNPFDAVPIVRRQLIVVHKPLKFDALRRCEVMMLHEQLLSLSQCTTIISRSRHIFRPFKFRSKFGSSDSLPRQSPCQADAPECTRFVAVTTFDLWLFEEVRGHESVVQHGAIRAAWFTLVRSGWATSYSDYSSDNSENEWALVLFVILSRLIFSWRFSFPQLRISGHNVVIMKSLFLSMSLPRSFWIATRCCLCC